MNIKAAEEKGEVRRGQVTWSWTFWRMWIWGQQLRWRMKNMEQRVAFNGFQRLFPQSFVQVVSHCCFAHEAPIPPGSVDLVHLPPRFWTVFDLFQSSPKISWKWELLGRSWSSSLCTTWTTQARCSPPLSLYSLLVTIIIIMYFSLLNVGQRK